MFCAQDMVPCPQTYLLQPADRNVRSAESFQPVLPPGMCTHRQTELLKRLQPAAMTHSTNTIALEDCQPQQAA